MRDDEVRQLLEQERARLERARSALLRDGLAEDTQRGSAGELSGMDEHLADVATETFDREVEIGLLRTVDAELDDIRSALARLLAGRYGRCRACGEVIPDDRLRAVPATALCRRHQDEAEYADAAERGGGAERIARSEASAHLDLLPSETPTRWPTPAEEAAVHIVPAEP